MKRSPNKTRPTAVRWFSLVCVAVPFLAVATNAEVEMLSVDWMLSPTVSRG